jgi:bifunctional enzyme CysN/CysC
VPAEVTTLKYRTSIDDRKHEAAKVLAANEIGFCNLATAYPVAFDPYRESRSLGSFILIDRLTRATIGAGMIEFPLRRATNVAWQSFDVTRERRAAAKAQQPAIVWFTGLSGSGKSTIANAVERHLHERGYHTFLLDGDNLRHGLNKDLGFTDVDRIENIRRAANVARLMADAGLVVLVALISPFRHERQMARDVAGEVKFIEIFVDAPLAVCQQRDPKGLYARAVAGKVPNLTGIDSPYEAPQSADLHLHTDRDDVKACVAQVVELFD